MDLHTNREVAALVGHWQIAHHAEQTADADLAFALNVGVLVQSQPFADLKASLACFYLQVQGFKA